MKNLTKIIAITIAAVTALVQVPAIQQILVATLTAHPNVAALVAGVAAILALIHNPQAPSSN